MEIGLGVRVVVVRGLDEVERADRRSQQQFKLVRGLGPARLAEDRADVCEAGGLQDRRRVRQRAAA